MDNSGRLLRQLTWAASSYFWTPDGERIIFDRRRGYFSEIYDVYSVNIDGTDEKMIYRSEDSIHFHVSDISPSGKYILVRETLLYHSPDGKLLNTDFEIVKIDLETREKIYLTDNDLNDGPPRYNNDGTKILYSVTIDDVKNFYIMSNDGSDKKKITNSTSPNEFGGFYAWSPDNKKIAYSKRERKSFAPDITDIYVFDIESGTTYQLTFTADRLSIGIYDWK